MSKTGARPRPSGNLLLEALSQSQIYLDYQRAFTRGTGLPLALQGLEMTHLVSFPKEQANPFCEIMAETNRACAGCYALQQELAREAKMEAKTLKCFAGLCESAVPVRVSGNLIAFLHTGQVLLHQPTRGQFSRIAATLLQWGTEVDLKSLKEVYFETRVLRPAQYESLVRLVEIFAGHLAACGHELLMRASKTEPPAVANARVFIGTHHTEGLSLARVAQAVNVSATYFSKLFKEATGMTFIDHVAHVRIEKAKHLLQNPRLRINEAAFQAGFRSLSQFNRTFKRIAGRPPKEFRAT